MRENIQAIIDKFYNQIVLLLVLAIIAVGSGSIIAKTAASPQHHAEQIASIDNKIQTAMQLTGAATATSALVSALPDDTCTPIADKLADLASSFLLVLCALNLEKYLLPITGMVAFRWLIPISCLLIALSMVIPRLRGFRHFAMKLTVVALMIYLLIPTSLKISDMIYETYQVSINETLDTAEQISEETQEFENAAGGNLLSNVTGKVLEIKDKVSASVSKYVQALAVMIVITCIIPLLVFAFFIVMINGLLQIKIPIPDMVARRR